jgi:hypothetical protein
MGWLLQEMDALVDKYKSQQGSDGGMPSYFAPKCTVQETTIYDWIKVLITKS